MRRAVIASAAAVAAASSVAAAASSVGGAGLVPSWPALPVLAALVTVAAAVLGTRCLKFLASHQQLRVQRFCDTVVHNGPGLVILNPLSYRSAEIVEAASLGPLDYTKIKDISSGSERIETGPKLLFLGPYDRVTEKGTGMSLSNIQYVRVLDNLSGVQSVVKGPCVWFPSPTEQGSVHSAVNLGPTEYVIVENQLTGESSTVRGPCVWFPNACEKSSPKSSAVSLQDDEYVLIKDMTSGMRWVKKGRDLVFPEPTWKIDGSTRKALSLTGYEYVRLLNVSTGKILVHRGEKLVFPGPDDQILDGGKKSAVEIDEEHAALVRDKCTGQLRLVTEKQIFVPGPNESIEEVRELIKLADHEAMIMKDRDGVFQFYYGSEEKRAKGQPRSFFLPPHAEIVKIWWSRGPRRESRDYSFERFDLRPHFMKFEFNCRTADNVELILDGVFFWELVDLPLMICTTGDTSGDITNHIRSKFIFHVSRMPLKTFMEELYSIAQKVLEDDSEFYEARGLKIHSLELTRYQCAEASTAAILQQIVQETTTRMNRLSQAASENEVNIFRMQGQVEHAQLNSQLLKIQQEQAQTEAAIRGKSEADEIGAFLRALRPEVASLEERMHMWQVLRKTDALRAVSSGGASPYYTPNDVDLTIETRAPTRPAENHVVDSALASAPNGK